MIINFLSGRKLFMSGLGKGEDARVVLDLLSRVKYFGLENNPWECPPVLVVSKGIGPMKKYYDELKRADPVLIDSRKVVFIGRSGAGKTRCGQEKTYHSCVFSIVLKHTRVILCCVLFFQLIERFLPCVELHVN